MDVLVRADRAEHPSGAQFSPKPVSSDHLLQLPPEILSEIVKRLAFPDNVSLKRTCRYFDSLVEFNHAEQVDAESSPYALSKDIYACAGCQRLRGAGHFADNMKKAKRRKGGPDAVKRFCIECGTSRVCKRVQGYSPGDHISIQGVHHVICIRCRRFSMGSQDEHGRNVSFCLRCTAAYERIRNEEMRQMRKKERAERRAARRAIWGSDYDEYTDDSSETPSLTWSEIQMNMVQAEADEYMNSPKAGSE